MAGFLVPSWYASEAPGEMDMNVASIIWGFSLGCTVFTCSKAVRQTRFSIKRGKRWTGYVVMVWLEWASCLIIGILSWLFLRGKIMPSFWIYLAFLVLWVIQIQCILQIIINRISLMMVSQHRALQLKWLVGVAIGFINISVFIIWIPARLQLSPHWIRINDIWDRCEKGIFCLIDLSLNLYFIYLVRSRLIQNGLSKYNDLFHFNLFMLVISMSMDIILIGVMSLPSGVVYIQFHPLVYLVKLHIEMNFADLIAKVVKGTPGTGGISSSQGRATRDRSSMINHMSTTITANRRSFIPPNEEEQGILRSHRGHRRTPTASSGIQKTVETEIVHHPKADDDDRVSEDPCRR